MREPLPLLLASVILLQILVSIPNSPDGHFLCWRVPLLCPGLLAGFRLYPSKWQKIQVWAATFSDMAVKGRVKITMLVYLVLIGGVMIYLDAPLGISLQF